MESLIEYPVEHDWFELKRNWDEPRKMGEYISALSNAAALRGREAGYLVWGVDDATHEVVGTGVDWNVGVGRKGHEEPLEHWLARQLAPDLAFRFDEGELRGKRVVLLTVPAASKVPTSFAGVRYGRIGSRRSDAGSTASSATCRPPTTGTPRPWRSWGRNPTSMASPSSPCTT